MALRVRFEVSNDPQDLARAVQSGWQCLEATPLDAYERRGMLSNLGLACLEVSEATGDKDHVMAAIRLLRQALDETPHDDPDRPAYALNLSVALRRAATMTQSATAADGAIAMAEHALQLLPPADPERAGCLSDLGRAHRVRADLLDDQTERLLATSYRREAANDLIASPTTRALAARAWAEWSRADGDLNEAVRGYQAAVRLLALVAWHGLAVQAGERHLRRWRDMAEQAASTSLDAQRQIEAVSLLEQGRTLRWSQLLDLRSDLSTLRAQYSTLADRLERTRRALDARRTVGAWAGDGST